MGSPPLDNAFLVGCCVVCGLGGLLAVGVWRLRKLWLGPMESFLALSPFRKAVVIALCIVATALAQKSGTNSVDDVSTTNVVTEITETNDVTGVSGTNDVVTPPPMMTFGFANPALTSGDATNVLSSDEIARGYSLASVVTNEALSYAAPADATEVGTWRLTGAYEDVVKVDLGEFRFPLGTNLCSSLWVYAWGKVRPQLKNATNEIAAVGAPMSAIPSVSRLWTATTTNGSFLITWQDFALGRVPAPTNPSSLIPQPSTLNPHPSSLFSAQLELMRSGDFVARSNSVESAYRRVNPDDWDDDGVANEDDDEPLVPGEPRFGLDQDLSAATNANAYCWVDLVVHQANARVTFAGDGPSNLPDPRFVAEAETTNRVVLLVGKTYLVTCGMPFEVVGTSSPDIDMWWEDDGSLGIRWLVLVDWREGNGKTFRMYVVPSGLGGSFVWTNCCCSISGGGFAYSYGCDGDCGCRGCHASGYMQYEGYRLPASGGPCGCTGDGGTEVPRPPPDDYFSGEPGVHVSFSKAVVFFEDEYDNSPTEHVPWNSTSTELCCAASGGPDGGRVRFEISGAGNLVQYGGYPLPYEVDIGPGETVMFTNVYRAVAASGSENDIVARATFEDAADDFYDMSIARATAVKVEIKAQVAAPENECLNRHKFGVLELVDCLAIPAVSSF